jgi:ketosteroid isomerase-like protein
MRLIVSGWRGGLLMATLLISILSCQHMLATQAAAQPAVERALVDTTKKINQAFVRGDLRTLSSLVSNDFTMLHGHMKRIENKQEAVNEWKELFAKRGSSGIAYYIKESDFKIQLYGNIAIVLFNYEHPRLEAGRLATEGGKAVYVFRRVGPGWVMVHCSTVRNDFSSHEVMP